MQQGSHPNRFLIDISERDGIDHYDPAFEIYGFSFNGNQWQQGNGRKGFKIAATKLIDGCFRYVFVDDGYNLIRYRLTEDDLEFDDYVYATGLMPANIAVRTEMELIEPDNGMIRLAIPGLRINDSDYEIKILDLNSNFEVISSSEQAVNLGDAEPYGVEFDASGRYLYFTHKQTPSLPNALDIWDTQTESFVSATIPTSMESFRQSFIERYGDDLFLTSDANIGLLPDASIPAASLAAFAPTHQGITPGYGSDALLGPTMMRYMLPDQVDDDDYGNFAEFSCECCKKYGGNGFILDAHTAEGTEVWSPNLNPFTDGESEVTIREELVIKAGADIDIRYMTFYFKPGARVIIERGDENTRGAMLSLKNSVFTLDYSCADSIFNECPDTTKSDTCEMRYWQGIEVWGYPNQPQPYMFWDGLTKPTFPTTPQGKFSMYDSSRVELAEIGVLVGSREHEAYGGGIATATESSFIDNRTGIKFQPYAPVTGQEYEIPNKSTVRGCEFDWTWGSTLIDSIPQLNAHVELVGISLIRLLGNEYKNSLPLLPMKSRGYGVRTIDSGADINWLCINPAGIHLEPCIQGKKSEFHNLHVGVSGLNSTNNLRKLKVYAADFNLNHYGVSLSNFLYPELLDNTFTIPRQNATRGVILTACHGYDVENNEFSHETGVNFPISAGLVISDSGEEDNYIYRNVFEDIRFGAVSQGVNGNLQLDDPGLQYFCNTFNYPIRQIDIYVMTGNISDE